MAISEATGELFPAGQAPAGVVFINTRCVLRTQDELRLVTVGGVVLAHYVVGDRMAEALAMVNLVEQGWAHQNDVARVFGISARTLRRQAQRFDDGGLTALGRPRGYPAGRARLPHSQARQLNRLRAKGLSLRELAERLGITEKAVRKRLVRLGWKRPQPSEPELPFDEVSADPKLSAFLPPPLGPVPLSTPESADPKVSAFSAPAQEAGREAQLGQEACASSAEACAEEESAFTLDADPAERCLDRLLAYLGLLEDAVPLFRSGVGVPQAGVLLALPALQASGVLECAKEVYGSLGPAFYGLRTTLLSLLLMALLRIKRPEGLKEHSPQDLGRILGLDRAPEVKTIRRKLARLAAKGQAAQFGRALAQGRVARHGAALGFLYVDGHVRVYHGQQPIPKTHVARLRLPQPGTTDYWVNDASGEPLFVVTAEANAGLVKMLPPLLAEVRALVGERRVTVVFDRGGFSPKLFKQLYAAGFDVLTYRRGRFRRVARKNFREQQGRIAGREVRYLLADQGVQLSGGVRLRQVTRMTRDGHQTPILTTRRDLPALEVAYRMFERWRQENFFKYLRAEYALDALLEHAVEPDNPEREVPNPQWQAATARLRQLRAAITALRALYGQAAFADTRQSLRGFKLAQAELGRRLRQLLQQCRVLKKKRAKLPQRVPVKQVVKGEVVRLATERQHLSNLLKMVAYQAECDLVQLLQPHYRRTEDEGRTLIQSVLASAADIEVAERELHVRLRPLSSPHRTRALAALCDQLNATPTLFPGTKLVLQFSVTMPNRH
jgi:prepilin-type processing-associated H-X9-DG protein